MRHLAHGFLRLRCGDYRHDKLVAFSCKRRGFCPACGARRMAQTALHRNIYLYCLVLDGVYRRNADGAPVLMEVLAPTDAVLRAVRVGEEGQTYMAEGDAGSEEAHVLRPLQAAVCT